jgi:thioredoxin reductase (NADPH)
MADVRDVIIIGSGPAGYTAAVYLARAQLSPLVFAGESWGGQLMLTAEIENFPGFKEGIMGSKLMGKMREQAERFGAEILDVNVSAVDFSGKPFTVWTGEGESKQEYKAKTVIIGSGARARMLGVGEERLLGRGVSTCAVCDAAFYKDKVTFVIGGGDAAMEEVLALVKLAKSVTLIHRRDKLRASKVMQQRVLKENKKSVKVLWNSEVREVKGEDKLEAIVIENKKTGEKQELQADGLFLAIGHVPETKIFKGQVELDEKGYLITHLVSPKGEDSKRLWLVGFPTMTSVPGVFAAGDVVDFRYRQAITAAGFGCMAALDVEKYLTGGMQSW